jgi:hypothetical protein
MKAIQLPATQLWLALRMNRRLRLPFGRARMLVTGIAAPEIIASSAPFSLRSQRVNATTHST